MDRPLRNSSLSNRSSMISPVDIQNILTQDVAPARPAPAEHVASPASEQASSTGRSSQDHPLRTNRFSLTFPIAPQSKEVSPTRAISPTRDDGMLDLQSPAGDSSSFLTAIAAQERRVLEIKEELQRAEADLDRLKIQWATHEAQKKKSDAKKATKMRPLSMMVSPTEMQDASTSSTFSQHQLEMERRKILLSEARTSNRRVFSGSRHTRTLSLLAPAQTGTSPSRPRGATSPSKSKLPEGQALPRAATTPDLSIAESKDTEPKSGDINIDKEMILETGRKVANGIKDGIWTFWEDLRQATVGEDIVQTHPQQHARKKSSVQTLRSPARGGRTTQRGSSRSSQSSKASIDTTRASTRSPVERRASPKKKPAVPLTEDSNLSLTTTDIQSPRRTPTHTRKSSKHIKSPSVALSAASSDAWDGWDESPKISRSSSATSESTSRPSPESSSPRAKDVDGREPIPWPALNKNASASTLRRSASHMMSEWDQSTVSNDEVVQGAETSS